MHTIITAATATPLRVGDGARAQLEAGALIAARSAVIFIQARVTLKELSK